MYIPKPSHPRPDRKRPHWLNLNGEWEFSLDTPTYDRRITVPFSWSCPLSGIGEKCNGTGYYRRAVRFPLTGGRPYLVIGGADEDCEVRLNGSFLASHHGGYLPIEVDLSPAWQDGENMLEIWVRDVEYLGQIRGKQAYGEMRGIWQTVYIEERPATHLADFFIRTACDGTVTIDCTPSAQEDGIGYTATFAGVSAEDKNGRITFSLPDPHPWSPDDPYLYEGSITMTSASGRDTVSTYFGLREIGCARGEDGAVRFTLNGEPIYLQGALDQGFHPEGYFTMPTDEDCREEILRVKRLGLNAVRFHAKCEEPLKLYYADSLGLFVLQDFPAYWGDANEGQLEAFLHMMERAILRDRNHPSIIEWIVFNESWGIRTACKESDNRTVMRILPKTVPWVLRCTARAKELDPTRLTEDNSPCLHDHTVTDVNSWHFYLNGYRELRRELSERAQGAYRGSPDNFLPPYTQGDQPLLCSECGFVWGVDGGAGDCDLSWHYKMMMNEFRLTPKLAGFVYTQLHDVVNEFNGYYRIDNTEKLFGYGDIVEGMSIADLHSESFLAYEAPPFLSLKAGEEVEIPLFLSTLGRHSGRPLTARYHLLKIGSDGEKTDTREGAFPIVQQGAGVFPIGKVRVNAPMENCLLILALALECEDTVLMRSFTALDVPFERRDAYTVPLNALSAEGFERTFTCIGGEKWNGLGRGRVSFTLCKESIPAAEDGSFVLWFEASARETFPRDTKEKKDREILFNGDCPLHPLEKTSSFPMSDGHEREGGRLLIEIGNSVQRVEALIAATADCRGILSHGYQTDPHRIDEDGSYGRLYRICVSAEEAAALDSTFRVELTATDGLSLFGRRSGRYPTGIAITAN